MIPGVDPLVARAWMQLVSIGLVLFFFSWFAVQVGTIDFRNRAKRKKAIQKHKEMLESLRRMRE